MKWLHRIIHRTGHYVRKPWYPILLSLLALADMFVLIVPTDGLVVTSAISEPKRGIALTFWSSVGSTLGAVLLFTAVSHYGMPALQWMGPDLPQSSAWHRAEGWIQSYGIGAVLLTSALPIICHPILALAALARLPLTQVAVAMLIGRLFKYGLYCWLASHSPKLLMRFKPLQHEIQEVQEDLRDQRLE
ncbi:MAG: VTT domain-containing protein [Bdellovibrionales bacterium]|nr:VTT domain-containing protein [Bdellovibrionales bacterium]